MTRTSAHPVVVCLFAVVWCLFVLCGSAPGGSGYRDKDFTLRMPAGLNRFSSYADVAGVGGASAGSKWGSSVNPASSAWRKMPDKFVINVSPQYAVIDFGAGTQLRVASGSFTIDLGQLGVVQPTVAQVTSNERSLRPGPPFGLKFDFDYSMDYYQCVWAKRLEDWAIGLNANYGPSTTRMNLGSIDAFKTRSDSYGARAGALHKLADGLLVGLVLDYAQSSDRTVMYAFLGPGTGAKMNDTTKQYGTRFGASYEYQEDSAVYLDHQFFQATNGTGRLITHRFLAGVDHQLVKGLFVRGGAAVDTIGKTGFTCGTGIYPNDWLTIDIGYQYDMFPELAPEMGRSHTFVLSVGLSF